MTEGQVPGRWKHTLLSSGSSLTFLRDLGTICWEGECRRPRFSKERQRQPSRGAGNPCDSQAQVLWLLSEPQEGTAVHALRWNVPWAGRCEWNVRLAPFYLVLFPSSGSLTEISASKYKFGEPEIVSELRDRAGWSSSRSISFLSFLSNMVRGPEAPSRTPRLLTSKHITSSTAEMQLPREVETQLLVKIIFLSFTLSWHCPIS